MHGLVVLGGVFFGEGVHGIGDGVGVLAGGVAVLELDGVGGVAGVSELGGEVGEEDGFV